MDMPGILSVLSDHGFADTTTARKVATVNDCYWDICSREPWPFLEKDLSLTFDGTNATPTNWPTDMGTVLHLVDTINGVRLYPMRIDELRTTYATVLTKKDVPQFYYFIGRQLYVYPIPPATQTLQMLYVRIPVALTDTSIETDILIPPRFHSLIYYCALSELYDMEDDTELAAKFEARYSTKLDYARNELWLRQADRYDTIEITDNEDRWS